MASRALPAIGANAETYGRVYDTLISQAAEPVILHWLGEMFDPGLSGYWGTADIGAATGIVLDLIERNAAKVDGIKISLLDQAHEEAFRARLPEGVRLYTGDDFQTTRPLIEGDGTHHSLRAFWVSSPPLRLRRRKRSRRWRRATARPITRCSRPRSLSAARSSRRPRGSTRRASRSCHGSMARRIISSMPAGFQSSREITHYAEVIRLADAAAPACSARSGPRRRMRTLSGLARDRRGSKAG